MAEKSTICGGCGVTRIDGPGLCSRCAERVHQELWRAFNARFWDCLLGRFGGEIKEATDGKSQIG